MNSIEEKIKTEKKKTKVKTKVVFPTSEEITSHMELIKKLNNSMWNL
jgi:hypothetical protein